MPIPRNIPLLLSLALAGCAAEDDPQNADSVTDSGPRILSAYHGLDALPDRASLICPTMVGGTDGMPVVFSVQIDLNTVTASAFVVETADGQNVTPLCATLAPAFEPLELRTVLLAGDFGTAEAPPRAVEVVGDVLDVAGTPLRGIRSEQITPLAAGPELVLAERFAPDTSGLAGECPDGTQQVVQMTWAGGVHGVGHLPLGEAQRLGTILTLEDGREINPIALADDDPDNHVHACLDTDSPARRITVAAGLFEDPGGDPNPATLVDVVSDGS